jgi:hypothetical protein
MLALNVSAEVLNAFLTMDKSIGESSRIVGDSNAQLFGAIEQQADAYSQFVPFKTKANEAQILVKSFYQYVGELKTELIETSGGLDENNEPVSKKRKEPTTRLFVNEGRGDELESKIIEIRKRLLDLVEDGNEKALLEKINPYLEMMGQKVLNIGETGKGASFKMIVNIMLGQSMIVFSEALLLGEKMGMDKDFLLNTLPNLVVAAPFTKFKSEMIRSRNYEVMFPLELMYKDMHLAALTAYELNQPLYLGNVAKELFANANKKGMGRLDFAAIHQYLEE